MDVLIADDEPLARERLSALLGELGGHRVTGQVGDGRAVLDACIAQPTDVVLLDIQMPEMDGLEAARHLSALEHPPAVIFCTAYDEHALAAFEAAAVDYLLKPVRAERLGAALQRAAPALQPFGTRRIERQRHAVGLAAVEQAGLLEALAHRRGPVVERVRRQAQARVGVC